MVHAGGVIHLSPFKSIGYACFDLECELLLHIVGSVSLRRTIKKEVSMKTPASLWEMKNIAHRSFHRLSRCLVLTARRERPHLKFGNKSCITLLMLGLLTLMVCPTLRADGLLILSPTPGVSALEGSVITPTIDFFVQNNTNQTLILDYAFFQISPGGGPDGSDFAWYPEVQSFALTLAPGAIGDYGVNFITDPGDPECTPTDCDFGLDPVMFAIEMRPLDGMTPPPVSSVSNINGKPVAISWFNFGPSNTPNPVALNDLLNLQNPQPGLLYNDGIIGTDADGNPSGQSSVAVHDTEPGTLLLLGSGLLGLAGLLRKRLFMGC
jgi:hypothetical protein